MAEDKGRISYQTALDSITTTNTFLLTGAFIGLNATLSPSKNVPKDCVAGEETADMLFYLEVIAFGCYVFSTLSATGTRLLFTLLRQAGPQPPAGPAAPLAGPLRYHRLILLIVASASVIGTFLLWVSILELIQLKLGHFSCSRSASAILVIVCVTVCPGLIFYGWTVTYAVRNYNLWDVRE